MEAAARKGRQARAGRQRAAHLGTGTRQAHPRHTQFCGRARRWGISHGHFCRNACICWHGPASSKPQATSPASLLHSLLTVWCGH
jgi:hypothetical protein